MTPFEYLLGILDKVLSDGNISKPIIPLRIERTVNGKKWSNLTPVERFNNRKGRVDGKPLELGLILDHTDFDVLTLLPGLSKSIAKGSTRVVNAAEQILDPKKRAAHAFVEISPESYTGKRTEIKNWIKGLLSGKDADINNPKWIKDENFGKDLTNYLPDNIENADKITKQTREDAWRIYNNLPLKHNMYILNTDGTYRYDMDKINSLSNNTFKPITDKLGNGNGTDYITSAGGGLTKNETKILKTTDNKLFGVQTIEDLWDLHPFSREGNLFSLRFPITKNIPGINKIDLKLKTFEVSLISGGKPFKMHTEIPFTRNFNLTNIENFKNTSNSLGSTNYGFISKDILPKEIFDYKSYGVYPNKFNSTNSIKYSDIINEYKYGGININPANKGKFTTTKKRTGKTTEELTHSKNPLTRKRTIFVQNASKWNHK